MKLKQLTKNPAIVAIAIQLLLAYEWVQGGLGKIAGGQFVTGINNSLSRFAEGSPHTWYVDSVLQTAQHSPQLFGQLVQWGELFAGAGLLMSVILFYLAKNTHIKSLAHYTAIAALLGGLTMNVNFYFAAGWSNTSTAGLNVLMFWMQIILIYHWLTASKKYIVYQNPA